MSRIHEHGPAPVLTWRGGRVYGLPQRVLIISDNVQDRETMRLLLASMGCRWVLASSLEEAIRILSRGSVAAAVLDSRATSWEPGRKNENLHDMVKYLAGRLILVVGENNDPRAMGFAQGYSLPIVRRERWAQELWGSLEAWLHQPAIARLVKEAAQLIVDTFRQPLPAGIRHIRSSIRHLLYETSSHAVDVSFERVPDSNSIRLAGQIISNVEPQRSLNGVRVALLGAKGLLGVAVTNQSGEFLFEFEKEPKIVIEIEDTPNHRVAIHSPNLGSWAGRADRRSAKRASPKSRRRQLAHAF